MTSKTVNDLVLMKSLPHYTGQQRFCYTVTIYEILDILGCWFQQKSPTVLIFFLKLSFFFQKVHGLYELCMCPFKKKPFTCLKSSVKNSVRFNCYYSYNKKKLKFYCPVFVYLIFWEMSLYNDWYNNRASITYIEVVHQCSKEHSKKDL